MQHISFYSPHQVDPILPHGGRQIASPSTSQITKFVFSGRNQGILSTFFLCSTRGALTGLFLFFVPARSHASVEHVLRPGSHDLIFISVEHVLRPGCYFYIIFYFYFIFFILLYFNSFYR